MDTLKYIHDPNYRAVIVRRLTPQIHGSGGIFDTAEGLYRDVLASKFKVKRRDGILEFDWGARVSFRHCQHEDDKYSQQGWQVSHYIIDEGQQLTETQVLYFMSRLRSEAKMKPCMRITCNPDKNSYLRKWIDWYLIPGTGLPDPEKCGVLRYFTMQDSQMVWGNSPEEVLEKVPGCVPLSFTFISANVYDNPVLMERQPEYVGWLEGLPRVEKARLLYGDWDATEVSAGLWKREWCEVVPLPNGRATKRVRAWDMACTLPSELNRDPDFTVGTLMSVDKEKYYYVEDVLRFRDRHQGVEKMILETAYKDGHDVEIRLPREPGASGLAYVKGLQSKLAEEGFNVRLSDTNAGKINRFAPFASASEAGFVKIVKADWNDVFFKELEAFDGGRKGHDDIVDTCSDGHKALRTSVVLPDFKLPDMTQVNTFASPWK